MNLGRAKSGRIACFLIHPQSEFQTPLSPQTLIKAHHDSHEQTRKVLRRCRDDQSEKFESPQRVLCVIVDQLKFPLKV